MNMTCDMFKKQYLRLKNRGNLIPSVMSIYFCKIILTLSKESSLREQFGKDSCLSLFAKDYFLKPQNDLEAFSLHSPPYTSSPIQSP